MYIGTFTHVLDAKGRVSLPKDFKNAVGESALVLLFKHPHKNTLFGGDADSIIEKASRQSKDLAEEIAAGGIVCSLEESGRIIIPKIVRDELFLRTKHLVFVGRVNYFELSDSNNQDEIVSTASLAALDFLSR